MAEPPPMARPAPLSFEPLVTTLIDELAAQPSADDVLLVLDARPLGLIP